MSRSAHSKACLRHMEKFMDGTCCCFADRPRTKPNPKRKEPRKGPIKDPEYVKWVAETQPCIVTGRKDVTIHHVRRYGSPKNDTIIVPLVAELHMLTHCRIGTVCAEHGKAAFYAVHGVDLEYEAWRLRKQYEAQFPASAQQSGVS